MKKIFGLLLITSLILAVGCKDDEGETPTTKEKTKTDLATEGEWRINGGTIVPSITIDIMGNVITVDDFWDLLAYQGGGTVQDCDKDNLMFLHTDSTVLLDEGPTKCDMNDPQSEDGGLWYFVENETKMKFSSFPFDPTGAPQTLDIETLTASNLDLHMVYEFVDPIKGDTTDHVIKINYVNTK
jgi:hypothetical protein